VPAVGNPALFGAASFSATGLSLLDSNQRATLYRWRALEIRRTLTSVADPNARRTLEEIANSYEALAAMREKPTQPLPPQKANGTDERGSESS